ncbi:MAG: PEP-CTERM sorting domain-containing protein [Paracoccaceae bacterium]
MPFGYVANAAISGGATVLGTNLASLGAVNGSYSWTAGNNQITLEVGSAPLMAVPLPSSALLLLAGLGLISVASRRRAS